MLVGLCVVGTFGITMVLRQLYLPRHVGVASGLSIGLAMGLGGIAAVGLGAVAEAPIDLETGLSRWSMALDALLLPTSSGRLAAVSRRRPDRHRLSCSIEPSVNCLFARENPQKRILSPPDPRLRRGTP